MAHVNHLMAILIVTIIDLQSRSPISSLGCFLEGVLPGKRNFSANRSCNDHGFGFELKHH